MALSDSSSSRRNSSHTRPSTSRHALEWQHAYEAVLAETDTDRLFKLVEAAEAAVLTRQSELEGSVDHHSERQVLVEARAKLLVVKKEKLKFL